MTVRYRRFLISLWLLVGFFLLPAAVLIIFPDRILESIRPWLERVASDRLDARVRIGSLSLQPLGEGVLRVKDLRLERGDEMRIFIPGLQVGYAPGGLRKRRLQTVRVEAPEVTLSLPAGDGRAVAWPTAPPVTISRLEMAGGRIEVQAAGRTVRLRRVELSGSLDDRSPFRLSAAAGEGEGVLLSAAGEAVWGPAPAIILQEAVWGERSLLTQPLTLRPAEGFAAGALRLDRFDERQLAALLQIFAVDSPLPAGWTFALQDPEIRFRFGEEKVRLGLRIPAATIASEGTVIPLEDAAAKIGRGEQGWEGEATFQLAGASGQATGRLAGERLTGTIRLPSVDPDALKRLLPGGDFPPLAGRLDLQAELVLEQQAYLLQMLAQGRSGEARQEALLDIAPLTAELTVEGSAASGPAGRGRVLLQGREILTFDGAPERLQAELRPTSGRDLRLLFPAPYAATLPADTEGLAGNIELARSEAGKWGGDLRLLAERVPVPPGELRALEINGRIGLGEGGVALRQLSLTARLEEKGMAAALAAAGSAEWGQRRRLRFDRFALTDFEYFAADGLSGLTGGHLEGSGTVSGRRGEEFLLFELTAGFGAREVLHGPFYADLSELPGQAAASGRFEFGSRRLLTEKLLLEVAGLGRAELQGELAPGIRVGGRLEFPDLATTRSGPIGQALSRLGSAFTRLRPAGELTAGFNLRQVEGGWRLSGEALPRGLAVEWPAVQLAARGIEGRLPFELHSRGGSQSAGEGRRGELRIEELHLGPAVLATHSLVLTADLNRFFLDSLRFQVAKGELAAGEVELKLTAAGPEAAARVQLRGIDLEQLTRELGWTGLTGRLSADLGQIRYTGENLETGGGMDISAFGGEIRVRRLRLESLFSGYATTHADVDFTGLDLHQLTRTLDFGEMNGTVDGYVRGLRLFGAVPSAFEALIETRPRGRRNISVKALKNLSVISQGGFSAILSRGIYRFIDFYRYRKIGIACSLHNDVFTLNGTARPGSDRYLVYGGLLPPKIDIVAPAHAISFKEMLRRLQRIERSERSDSAEGN